MKYELLNTDPKKRVKKIRTVVVRQTKKRKNKLTKRAEKLFTQIRGRFNQSLIKHLAWFLLAVPAYESLSQSIGRGYGIILVTVLSYVILRSDK